MMTQVFTARFQRTRGGYGHWGYTTYRAYYGPGSGKHWFSLIYSLKAQINLALDYYDGSDNSQELRLGRGISTEKEVMETVFRIKKLFRLEIREDASLLDGFDINQVRQKCLKGLLAMEKTMKGP